MIRIYSQATARVVAPTVSLRFLAVRRAAYRESEITRKTLSYVCAHMRCEL